MHALKFCPRCQTDRALLDFCKDKKTSDGLNRWCRICTKEYKAQHYLENKERLDAINRAWREANPERLKENREAYYAKNSDKVKARAAKWREENLEHARTYSKLAYHANGVERAAYGKKRYAEKREEILAKSREWYAANKEKAKATVRARSKNFPERKRSGDAVYRALNKEKLDLARKIWRANNPGRVAQHNAARKARELKATPVWADFKKIHAIYKECAKMNKETGLQHHVDHIVPLQGKLVCGLHVHENLQILTKAANLKKTNKFEVL